MGFLSAGALEAAPRGRDLLKLAHCRTDSSPARPTKTSNREVGRVSDIESCIEYDPPEDEFDLPGDEEAKRTMAQPVEPKDDDDAEDDDVDLEL